MGASNCCASDPPQPPECIVADSGAQGISSNDALAGQEAEGFPNAESKCQPISKNLEPENASGDTRNGDVTEEEDVEGPNHQIERPNHQIERPTHQTEGPDHQIEALFKKNGFPPLPNSTAKKASLPKRPRPKKAGPQTPPALKGTSPRIWRASSQPRKPAYASKSSMKNQESEQKGTNEDDALDCFELPNDAEHGVYLLYSQSGGGSLELQYFTSRPKIPERVIGMGKFTESMAVPGFKYKGKTILVKKIQVGFNNVWPLNSSNSMMTVRTS